MKVLSGALLGLALAARLGVSYSQTPAQEPDWNRPVEPFRIIGNIYYVGTNELGAYLLKTSEGAILVDGGLPQSAQLIAHSIEAIGVPLGSVKILVTTQAHFDHVGSLAELAQKTGGRVMVMAGDAELVEKGGHGDYLFGDTMAFPPAKVGEVLHDGSTITLGGTTLVAHLTPGHTKGCTTWTTTVREDGLTYAVVFPGSGSVNPGTRSSRIRPEESRYTRRDSRVSLDFPSAATCVPIVTQSAEKGASLIGPAACPKTTPPSATARNIQNG